MLTIRKLPAACALLLALGAPAASPAQEPAPPADPQTSDVPLAQERHEPTAEEIEAARQTARDGLAAYKSADYAKAVGLFEKARAVYPSAQVLRMAGYSHLALQRWQEAVGALEAALGAELGPLSPEDRKEVEDQLAKALAHFGKVAVTTSVKGATLLVDDDPPRELPLAQPLRLLEGGHHLVVRAPGHRDAVDDVVVEGGKELDVSLDPKPTAAPPPPPPPKEPPPPPEPGWQGTRLIPAQREIGLAAAGTGLALGGAALVTALAGAHLRSNVEGDVSTHEQNYGSSCDRGEYRLCVYDRAVINNDADRADALRDSSVWLGIGGGALFAIGTTLFLIAPDGPLASKESKKPQVGLSCAPGLGGIACAGTF